MNCEICYYYDNKDNSCSLELKRNLNCNDYCSNLDDKKSKKDYYIVLYEMYNDISFEVFNIEKSKNINLDNMSKSFINKMLKYKNIIVKKVSIYKINKKIAKWLGRLDNFHNIYYNENIYGKGYNKFIEFNNYE